MAITSQTYQFLNQQNLTRLIDVSGDVEGPKGTVSYWLVPSNGYINGQRVPHAADTELQDAGFDKTTVEGLEYYLVPEESSNTPGLLSHYAQRTGPNDLANPNGGINRVRESFGGKAESAVTVAPEAVAKYVDDNDAYEEARKKASAEDERVTRQVTVSPAREPSESKLVETSTDDTSSSSDSSAKTSSSSSSASKSTPPKSA